MKKDTNILKIIIIIIAIVLILAISYVGYHYLSMLLAEKEAEVAADEFENEVKGTIIVGIEDENKNNEEIVSQEPETQEPEPQTQTQTPATSSSSSNKSNSTGKTVTKYKEYSVIGTIQIPRTRVKSVIVDKITPSSISAAVGVLYGSGLNQIGNTVLAAHNYRNGTFFSNNKLLENGDKIYITDQTGLEVEYEIYNTYITTDSDISYANRNTNRKT